MLTKIKSTHLESQGPFVLINTIDFDETKHELYVEGDVAEGDGTGEKLPPASDTEKVGAAVKRGKGAKK